MSKSGKFILGALLGAAAAALLTPVEGRRARRKLAQLAEKRGLDVNALQAVVEKIAAEGKELVRAAERSVKRAGGRQRGGKNNKKK